MPTNCTQKTFISRYEFDTLTQTYFDAGKKEAELCLADLQVSQKVVYDVFGAEFCNQETGVCFTSHYSIESVDQGGVCRVDSQSMEFFSQETAKHCLDKLNSLYPDRSYSLDRVVKNWAGFDWLAFDCFQVSLNND